MEAAPIFCWILSRLCLLAICKSVIYQQCQLTSDRAQSRYKGYSNRRRIFQTSYISDDCGEMISGNILKDNLASDAKVKDNRQEDIMLNEKMSQADQSRPETASEIFFVDPPYQRFLLKSARNTRRKRKVNEGVGTMWETEIYWTLDNISNSTEEGIIHSALNHWQSHTCLTFTRKDDITTGPYVRFVKSDICSSIIGKIGDFAHDIEIGSRCLTMGKVAHEIGHVLGMFHEHSRPDRDRYVDVDFDNVEDGLQPNFDIVYWGMARTEGIPYDYGSAMHYGRKTFAKKGTTTLATKESGYEQTIGQRRAMSFYDFKLINYLYCSNMCGGRSLTWTLCDNDGYKDPNHCSECACPEGFQPPFCSHIQKNEDEKCLRQHRYSRMYSWSILSSPGHPNGYPGPTACYWIIMTYRGTRVVIHFEEPFSLHCATNACEDYVEIRTGDLARTGPRYCCSRPNRTINADGNKVMVLFRSTTANSSLSGFRLRYRSEGCGGCIYPYPAHQRACSMTRKVSCNGTFRSPCESNTSLMCEQSRINSCYETIKTCCRGYRLDGDNCINAKRQKSDRVDSIVSV